MKWCPLQLTQNLHIKVKKGCAGTEQDLAGLGKTYQDCKKIQLRRNWRNNNNNTKTKVKCRRLCLRVRSLKNNESLKRTKILKSKVKWLIISVMGTAVLTKTILCSKNTQVWQTVWDIKTPPHSSCLSSTLLLTGALK